MIFKKVDNDSNGAVSFAEFQAAAPELTRWGLDMSDASKTWAEAQSDAAKPADALKGDIPFDDFVSWAMKQAEAPDNDDDDAATI